MKFSEYYNSYDERMKNREELISKLKESKKILAKLEKKLLENEDKGKPTVDDQKKVDDILKNDKYPEDAEDGKAYVVHWADGRGVFAVAKKSALQRWLNNTGDWAEIISIKYTEPIWGKDKERLRVKKDIKEGKITEKAKSKQQQKFMGMVHAIQKGELSPSKVSPKMQKVAKTMEPKDVEDFAKTKHKGLPKKVKTKEGKNQKRLKKKQEANPLHDYKRATRKHGDLPPPVRTHEDKRKPKRAKRKQKERKEMQDY